MLTTPRTAAPKVGLMTPPATKAATLLTLALLAGCQSSLGPMSWTSGYREVTLATPDGQGTTTRTLANLCQSEPEQSGLIPLPPGCANDLNLQLMVVDPGDLTHGRAMGPARAAPLAAAASQRLDNRGRANERRVRLENEARQAMGSSATTDGL
ncbi:hypothetical protein [Salinicola endophyticus]|uniref:Uncharacterized protein n=1 Tax=Salinicola endophyticus TaxID=1949083 RepID=A0AB74UE96_9GAMM